MFGVEARSRGSWRVRGTLSEVSGAPGALAGGPGLARAVLAHSWRALGALLGAKLTGVGQSVAVLGASKNAIFG